LGGGLREKAFICQHPTKRKNLTLFISPNNGQSWPQQIILYAKQAAYNDLAVLPNGDLLCVFETGKIWPYSGIVTIIMSKSLILK
jgi:sialidase-1